MTHWQRPWCWERLRARGEGGDRGWDGWMASLTQWTWVWAWSRSWWWTGKPGVLQTMGSQRVGHDWATEQRHQWWEEMQIPPPPSPSLSLPASLPSSTSLSFSLPPQYNKTNRQREAAQHWSWNCTPVAKVAKPPRVWSNPSISLPVNDAYCSSWSWISMINFLLIMTQEILTINQSPLYLNSLV